jgi:cytochrome c oxidase cbb3-type subunit 2
VALVAYPSLLAPASSAAQRGRQAGWLYAIAGWFGSAMGIGMGQNLGHVPPAFVLLAGIVILLPVILGQIRWRRRELGAVIFVAIAASCIDRGITAIHPDRSQLSSVERGRRVYIEEGCINCHSQYVRPETPDALMWGPFQSPEELRREQPPLIGNRRQGPDLAEVGSRRSPLWLRAHFYHPSEVSYASFMPRYDYLLRDRRGDDLISYLQTLRCGDVDQHLLRELAWSPSSTEAAAAEAGRGARLFDMHCATCHASNGLTRLLWRTSFRRLPSDLTAGPFLHLSASDAAKGHNDQIERIVKFGIPGTDMPGHEYLQDQEIVSISLWIAQRIKQPIR